MIYISKIGNNGFIWILCGLFMICFKKYRKCGFAVILSLILCLILGNGVLKNLIARERPCWIDETIDFLIKIPRDYSFPSGHTLSSFASAFSIFFFHKKKGIYALILASLIGFSRLYLFVHFPSDILGGIIIGVIISLFSKYIIDKIYKKNEH